MASGKTCGRCKYFIKIAWNDHKGTGRNGMCSRFDYNVWSDGTFAKGCKGFKGKRYKRLDNTEIII